MCRGQCCRSQAAEGRRRVAALSDRAHSGARAPQRRGSDAAAQWARWCALHFSRHLFCVARLPLPFPAAVTPTDRSVLRRYFRAAAARRAQVHPPLPYLPFTSELPPRTWSRAPKVGPPSKGPGADLALSTARVLRKPICLERLRYGPSKGCFHAFPRLSHARRHPVQLSFHSDSLASKPHKMRRRFDGASPGLQRVLMVPGAQAHRCARLLEEELNSLRLGVKSQQPTFAQRGAEMG